mgnify:CR=1 FL=1
MVEKSLLEKVISLSTALISGKDVSAERIAKRLEICSSCEKVQVDDAGNMSCGVCGCALKEKGLINLARYEEQTGLGCKYPGSGSKWKAAGW